MRYRRSTKLATLPIVAAVIVAVIVATGGGAAVVSLIGLYWIIAATSDYSKQLSVDTHRLEMHGYFGGPVVIDQAEARLCTYVPFRVHARSLEVAFLEISDTRGRRLKVWRFGWGRRSRSLFCALRDWLGASPAEITPEAQRFLERRAG